MQIQSPKQMIKEQEDLYNALREFKTVCLDLLETIDKTNKTLLKLIEK